MLRGTFVMVSLGVVVSVVLFGPRVFAQGEGGAISGVVKDTSGAVVPGVTVEASSPALIEKSRSVVTDSDGLYKIIDLRPGTYVVTFTLSGFSTAGTMYGDRIYQADLRFSKTIKIGRTVIRPTVSAYNLFNANPILAYNLRYGPAWLDPTTILTARFVDFGAQVEF